MSGQEFCSVLRDLVNLYTTSIEAARRADVKLKFSELDVCKQSHVKSEKLL